MMFEDEYKTISGRSEGIFKDRGSKFIAIALPAHSEEEVKDMLENLRKEYHDARHHCYAYVLGFDKSAYRFNDDGEPSGTAGRPIHGQILSHDLTNVLVVVVRYFGGIKLGVPGLIRAYKTASQEALQHAAITRHTVNDVYQLTYDYPLMNDVMRIIKEEELDVVEQDFQLSCRLVFRVRKNHSTKIFDRFSSLHGVRIGYLKTV